MCCSASNTFYNHTRWHRPRPSCYNSKYAGLETENWYPMFQSLHAGSTQRASLDMVHTRIHGGGGIQSRQRLERRHLAAGRDLLGRLFCDTLQIRQAGVSLSTSFLFANVHLLLTLHTLDGRVRCQQRHETIAGHGGHLLLSNHCVYVSFIGEIIANTCSIGPSAVKTRHVPYRCQFAQLPAEQLRRDQSDSALQDVLRREEDYSAR